MYEFDRARFEYLSKAAGLSPSDIQEALCLSPAAYYARLQGRVIFSVEEALMWADLAGAKDEFMTVFKIRTV